jgi:acyl-CoA thioesterase-1
MEESGMDDAFNIVALGDSLTEGYGVAPWQSYPARLQGRLNEAGISGQVVNAGISGDTCRGVLARLGEVLLLGPDLVIVEIGINDFLLGALPDRIQNHITAIVERIQAEGVFVMLAGMELPPVVNRKIREEFADIYPAVAEALHLTWIPGFTRPLFDEPGYLQLDGLHPTAEGYEAITEHILPWVVRAVRELHSRR